jgi:hypothetical protein
MLRKYLADPDITAEIARAMALAYDKVRAAFTAMAIEPPLEEIAGRIAEEARKGTHDGATLAQLVLSSLAHEEKASGSISPTQIEGRDVSKQFIPASFDRAPSMQIEPDRRREIQLHAKPRRKGRSGLRPIEGTASARELSNSAAGREN